HAEGELQEGERELIHNVFGFHDRTVAEVAVPRTDLECWEMGLPVAEMIDRIRTTTHSRIPIFQRDRDQIVGILYIKDFLRQAGRKNFGPEERLTKKMLRPPLVVPGGMKLDRLFRRFRHERTHVAIVQDEFGGTLGLVSMTDLLEQIFGEIKDEHEEVEETWITQEGEDSYLCQGRVRLGASRLRGGEHAGRCRLHVAGPCALTE
ncbi:MAG: CBS domain-containing protein, partial [Nitrospinae bacterium]|nr:CBS domain-containing protein [Nitrospinota bacterium]